MNGDWWPDRDETCHRVAYDFKGAEHAIRQCRKLDLVIQAGGCVGAWPRYLRSKFRRVVTFEPSWENWELMRKNLSGVDVEMVNAALGERSGRCSMKENPRNCGDDQTREGGEVETVAIDDLSLDPDLIYLDIQGDEPLALKGAQETLDRCNPIVAVEYDPKMFRHGDPKDYLESIGYQVTKRYKQDLIFAR